MKQGRKFSQQLFRAYSVLISALLLMLFIGIFVVVYNDQIRKEINAQQEFVQKTQQQVDMSLQNMDRIVSGLLFNKDFMQIMKTENMALSYTKYSNEILDTFVSLDAPLFLSHRIIAFTPETYFTFTKNVEDQTHILNAIKSYEPYNSLIQANGDKVILPVHNDPFGVTDVPVYSVARTVNDGLNVYGVIEVQNNYEQLESFCSVDFQPGDCVLFSEEGEVVYPWKQSEDETFLNELYAVIADQPGRSGSFQWENHQISYMASDYSEWITVIYSPLTNMLPDWRLGGFFLLSFAVALFSLLGLVRILTNRLTAPLSKLNRQINKISYENLSVRTPNSYDIAEIENINRSFQAMLKQLEIEIEQNAQARANEERANYIALESLMNPHTIYNTITMIESVCYMNGDYEAADLCIAFSQMLRYISDNTRSTYTVEDELQHLNHYAILMKKRYEGRLLVEVSADPALLAEIIPKFTLQPLVENAIKHGMNRNTTPFIVRVAIETAASGWRIRVTDNGKGFAQEKIEEVYALFAYSDHSLQGNKKDILNMKIDNMALNNIYIRWRIMKGSDFRIRIDHLEPSGCVVELAVTEGGELQHAKDMSSRG
ncbi:cache domain-containing sensor histidine kinase [Paenibacillus soyae]|uniref:Histidine kinase n=1 Tax=Paenibacillus soyae TaxID=2969249 RepID=A0A9X2MNY7_9BACL|nr:sensor histidine kinase [Paenibacillus soyae]MCR2803552.1 histidine kinase [Paenibacillus soyae]